MTDKNNARANNKVDYQITATNIKKNINKKQNTCLPIQYVHILGKEGLQKPFPSVYINISITESISLHQYRGYEANGTTPNGLRMLYLIENLFYILKI